MHQMQIHVCIIKIKEEIFIISIYMNDLIITLINIKEIQKFKNYLNQELEIKYIRGITYCF